MSKQKSPYERRFRWWGDQLWELKKKKKKKTFCHNGRAESFPGASLSSGKKKRKNKNKKLDSLCIRVYKYLSTICERAEEGTHAHNVTTTDRPTERRTCHQVLILLSFFFSQSTPFVFILNLFSFYSTDDCVAQKNLLFFCQVAVYDSCNNWTIKSDARHGWRGFSSPTNSLVPPLPSPPNIV